MDVQEVPLDPPIKLGQQRAQVGRRVQSLTTQLSLLLLLKSEGRVLEKRRTGRNVEKSSHLPPKSSKAGPFYF